MNRLNEPGSYWMANTFVWSWLLLPILPLGDLVKQDVATRLHRDIGSKQPYWLLLLPYATFASVSLVLWLMTFPAWRWFVNSVLRAEKPDLVLALLSELVPCYACFAFAGLAAGVLYALGRTDLLALKAAVGNAVIAALFALFSHGLLFAGDGVFAVAAIFGLGLVLGTALNFLLLAWVVKKQYYL